MGLDVSADGGKDFELVPAGIHPAYCYGLIDFGTQSEPYEGQMKQQKKVQFLFELPTLKDSEGKPYTIGSKLTASLHEKSKLYKWLISWRGKPFNPDELKKFSLTAVVGKACMLNVIHLPKKDGSGKNSDMIDGIFPAQKGPDGKVLAMPALSHATVKFDIDDWDLAKYQALPPWMQRKIAASPEGKAKLSGQPAPQQGGAATQDADGSLPF